MTVYITFADGGRQESYGVRDIEIREGVLRLDKRALRLDRIVSLTTRGAQAEPSTATKGESGSGEGT